MKPEFNRGDIVISKKIKGDKKDIKIGDVIEYNYKGKIIMHRVIGIQEDIWGYPIFTTKGDNNSGADEELVSYSQVQGIINYSIRYIGYPSILFKEWTNLWERK